MKYLMLVLLFLGCAAQVENTEPDAGPDVGVVAQEFTCKKHVFDVIGKLGVWCAASERANRWPPAIYEIKCHEPIYDGWSQNPIYHGEGYHSPATAWTNFGYKLSNKWKLNTRYPGLQIKTETSTQFCDVVY